MKTITSIRHRFYNGLYLLLLTQFSISVFSQQKPFLRIAAGEANNNLRDILITKDKRSFLFCGEDKTIHIRDSRTGEIAEVIYPPVDYGPQGLIYAAALSVDEQYLALGGLMRDSISSMIRIYDFQKRVFYKTLSGNFKSVHTLDFSNDGKYLVSGGADEKVMIWELATGKCISVKAGFNDYVYQLKVVGRKIIAVSFDGSITKWNFKDSLPETKIQGDRAIYSIGYCPVNKLIAASTNNNVYLFDTSLNILDSIQSIDFPIGGYGFSPDGKYLVASAWIESQRKSGFIAEIEGRKFKRFSFVDSTFGSNNALAFIDNQTLVFPTSENSFALCKPEETNGQLILKRIKTLSKGMLIPYALHEKNNQLSFVRYDQHKNTITDSIKIDVNTLELSVSKQLGIKKVIPYTEVLDTATVKMVGWPVLQLKSSSKPFLIDGSMGWGLNRAIPLNDSLWIFANAGYLTIADRDGQTKLKMKSQFSLLFEMAISEDRTKLYTYTLDRKLYIWSIQELIQNHDRKLLTTPVSEIQSFAKQLDTARLLPALRPFLNLPNEAAWDSSIEILSQTDSLLWFKSIVELKSKKSFLKAPTVEPLATFYLSDEKEWVLSTPEGYYLASPNGGNLAYWQLNRGENQLALTLPTEALAEKFYRPDLIFEMLKTSKHLGSILKEKSEKPFTIEEALFGVAQVNITAEAGNALASKEIKITVRVAEQQGVKVKDIKLLLNGRLLPDQLLFSKVRDSVTKDIVCHYKVPLVYGANNFSAIAINERKIQSPSANLRFDLPKTTDSANLFLLVMGIDEYAADELKLTYAVNDAQSIAQEIGGQKVSGYKNIETEQLLNRYATKENLRNLLLSMRKKMKPQDVFVLFYSGHAIATTGTVDQLTEFYMGTTSLTSIQETNTALSAQAISSTELKELFALIPCSRQLLLLDACQSAGAALSFKRDRSLTTLSKNSGLTIFAATRSKQSAYEYTKLGHGAFTQCLIEGLRGNADETENATTDQQVTVSELIDYVKDRLPELLRSFGDTDQSPVSFKGSEDFVISWK